MITGASDVYVPADPDLNEADFRWDRPGQAIVDTQLERWVEAAGQSLVVVSIEVDRCAGFTLRFARETALEVFPDAFAMPHDVREHWRLFRPGVEEPHFVATNHGWGRE